MNVSFIVIAHKSSGTLELCLRSVERIAKNQDELILVLNNPDYKTRSISQIHTLWKIIEEKNPGPAFARNAGAENAEKDFLCFLDSDIGLNPGWHEKVEEKFTNPWLVAGQFKIEPERKSTVLNGLKRFHYLHFNARYFKTTPDVFPLLDTANLIIKRDWFNRLNGFDTGLRYLEDTEFSLRLLREGADIFFDTRYSVSEFYDSEETLWDYIFKQFEKSKVLPRVMALHSLDFHFSRGLSSRYEIKPPGAVLKFFHYLIKMLQFAGLACTPYPIYLNHSKAGRIQRNQKKFILTGSNPTKRSIWVNKKEKIYDIFLKQWG